MKPHRFSTAFLCAMIFITTSCVALAVRPYSPRPVSTAYNRYPHKLASGYMLPSAKSLTSQRLSHVPHSRQYLEPLRSWSGLSGTDRRKFGDVSPTGEVRARSRATNSGARNTVNNRFLGTKVNAPNGPYRIR